MTAAAKTANATARTSESALEGTTAVGADVLMSWPGQSLNKPKPME